LSASSSSQGLAGVAPCSPQRAAGRIRRRSRQRVVELPGEGVLVAGAEGGWAAGVDAGAAQGIHEVAQGQGGGDAAGVVGFAARGEDADALGDEIGGERDVGGDDEVAGLGAAEDFAVSDVDALCGEGGTASRRLAMSVRPMPVRLAAR